VTVLKGKIMRLRVACCALMLIAGHGIAAMAQDQVKLFKIVSPKDDVVIGLTTTELRGLGTASDLDNLARHLATDGQMTVWQYAVRHDQAGNLQQAPLRRIAVFKNDTFRIEPYSTPLPIVPPAQ
jgi:hypothetical protein